MRASLLYNPMELVERLGLAVSRRRRRQRLRHTPAARLTLGEIASMELLELVRPEPAVIYDIGANIGTWTCLAKSLFPAARVEAFEPLAIHLPRFREITAPWPKDVRLHPCALGPTKGTATMQVTVFSDASSLLPLTDAGRAEFQTVPAREEQVPLIPLDVLVEREGLPWPDLLKLDVQGYEMEVLRGATASLRHARAVISEVSFQPYYQGQVLFPELLAFLTDHGFALHAFSDGTPTGRPVIQADILFVRVAGLGREPIPPS